MTMHTPKKCTRIYNSTVECAVYRKTPLNCSVGIITESLELSRHCRNHPITCYFLAFSKIEIIPKIKKTIFFEHFMLKYEKKRKA